MSKTRRLREARHRRSLIAAQFNALEQHDTTLERILERPPACLRRMRIYDVIRRAPKMSNESADKVLRASKVWPTTTLGNLSELERELIIDRLPPRAK